MRSPTTGPFAEIRCAGRDAAIYQAKKSKEDQYDPRDHDQSDLRVDDSIDHVRK
jgi:hypothetical protein